VTKFPATWEDVQPGYYIEDKTFRIWRVTDFEPVGPNDEEAYVHMVSGEKKGRIPLPQPLTPVTIVVLSTQELLELELGAKEAS
jgi:hypothetical protein